MNGRLEKMSDMIAAGLIAIAEENEHELDEALLQHIVRRAREVAEAYLEVAQEIEATEP